MGMLLPEDQDANIIMLATGTGIAPMRSYMRLLFNDKVGAAPDGSRKFKGLAWLFMGVPYSNSLLYDDEHKEYASKYPEQFRYDYAISREQKNAAGQKMYIQTKMAEYTEDLWELMQKSNARVHVRPQGHGGGHGGVFRRHRVEERLGVEGIREADEKGWPLPRRGVLKCQEHCTLAHVLLNPCGRAPCRRGKRLNCRNVAKLYLGFIFCRGHFLHSCRRFED